MKYKLTTPKLGYGNLQSYIRVRIFVRQRKEIYVFCRALK